VLGNSWQLKASTKTLAEHFRDAGYRTAAFVSAVVLDPRCGLDRGFGHYSAITRPGPEVVLGAGPRAPATDDPEESRRRRFAGRQRSGEETVNEVLAWLDGQKGDAPLFLWVHLYDPHQPYDPPQPYRQLFGSERGDRSLSGVLRPSFNEWQSDLEEEQQERRDLERQRQRARPTHPGRMPMLNTASLTDDEKRRVDELYDGEIALADFQVGRLLAWLKGRGLYQDALVAVMGDHGETLGEHLGDYYGHHHVLYDTSLQIPLVLRLPGGGSAALPATSATTIDMTPTLLRAAGLASPAGLDGRDLLSGPVSRPVYCETYLGVRPTHRPGRDELRPPSTEHRQRKIHQHAVRDGRWKLVMTDSGASPPMLFDLKADPAEQTDVAGSHEALVKALSRHWQRWCEAHGLPERNRDRRPAPGVDEEMRDRLRQLGYVE